jgi:hypothetical protein
METCKLCGGYGLYVFRSELTLSKARLDTKVQCPRCAGKGQVLHNNNLDTASMTNAELASRVGHSERGYYPLMHEIFLRLEASPDYRRVNPQHVSCTSGGVK